VFIWKCRGGVNKLFKVTARKQLSRTEERTLFLKEGRYNKNEK
jgi:hypothetical protein